MIVDVLSHFLVALVIFAPLEALLPRHKHKKILRRFLFLDVTYAILAALVIVAGMTGLFYAADLVLRPLAPTAIRDAVSGQPLALQVIEIVVIADLGYYFIHRMFHEVPGLWRFHAVHHSIEDMDWLAASRVHPVDQILTRGVSLIPVLLLGFDILAVGAFGFFFSWHSVLKHSNVNVSFGVFRWLIASPAYHHWHHANQREAFDRNFAGQLPFIDLLFGTAIMKESEAPTVYGTDDTIPQDFTGQLAAPFQRSPMIAAKDSAQAALKRS